MPRISTYTKDVTIVDEDLVLGSNYVRTYNGIKEYNTRSFKLEDLASYFNTKFTSASIDTNSITATELNISGNGSSGQFIMSDGDGSFSYLSILDEDNMSSNSATAPASQQSIKAYVDSQIATEDTIAELNDTTIGTLANAHLLIYDNDSSVWENKALSGDATITKDGVISLASSHTNIDSILNASLAVGRDADNQIKYSTDNQIIFRVDGGDNVVFKGSGEIEATSLDISGDIDIDGTTNLDAVDIDGAVQIDNTVTAGVDDTGYDVKFFGDTSGKYTMWDTSQDALLFSDNAYAYFGNDADLRIHHNASASSYIQNYTNDLYIQNNAADKDIKFYSDDGNGGLFEYFSLDGSEATYTASATTAAYTIFPDKSRIALGAGKDLQIYHDGSNSYISESGTGGLVLDASGISGTAIKDEDNMASDSATHLATQQSIKAYVDAQVDTEDTLAELDDTNISSAAAGQILVYDNTASVWDNVALTAGDLIDVTGGDGTLEIDVDLTEAAEAAIANGDYMLFLDGGATGTPKKEALHDIATLFSGTGLTATNSVIAVDAAQTQITSVGTLAAGAISSGFGNIDNGSSTFNTGAATVDSLSVSDGNITNVGDIALDTISADGTTINVAMTDNTDGAFSVKQGSDKYIAIDTTDTGEDIAIGTGVSGTAITIGHTTSETTIQDNLTVTGNLKVNGDQVYQNVTSMAVSDPIISLQTGTDGANLGADSNKDVGLAMFWHNGSAAKTAFLGFDDSAGKLTFIPDASISSEVASGSVGIMVANLEGNVTGDVTGTATNASHVLVTDNESTNEENLITFIEGATSSTGNVGLEMDGNLTYNPSTGTVTATGFSGNLTGTLQTAAQANVTSLGTLTTLTVDNVIINGTTIGHTSDTDLITLADGATTFTGTITGTTASFIKDQNADSTIKLYNANSGSAAQATMYITNSSTNADGLFLGSNGTGMTTAGGFVADGAVIGSGTGASAGLAIMARESSSGIKFYTGGHTDLALTIDSSQNATFAGDVTISGGHLGLSGFPRTDLHATWNQMFIGSKGSLISENGSGGIAGMTISDNLYIDSDTGTYAYLTTNEASQLIQEAGILTFKNAASGSAGAAPALTERFKVDASNTVTISSGDSGGDAAVGAPVFRINNTTESADWDVGDIVGSIEYYTSDESGNAPYVTSFIKSMNITGNGTLPDGALSFGTAVYNTSGGAAERMRIDHQGDLTIIASYGGGTDPLRVGHGTYDSFTPTFTINDNGYVGIGTDPDVGLEVYGGSNTAAKIKITNTAPTPDNEWSIYANYNSQDLIFLADSTEVLRLGDGPSATFAGSVDIGTFTIASSGIVADAGMTLQIGGGSVNALTLADSSGNATFAANLTVSGTDNVINTGNSGNFDTSDANSYPRITLSGASAQLGLFRSGSSVGGSYIGGDSSGFKVRHSDFATTFHVDTSGNTMPGQYLWVNATATLDSEWLLVKNTTSGTYACIGAWNTATSGVVEMINFYTEASSASARGQIVYSNTSGDIQIDQLSDRSLKENIKDLDGGLKLIGSLKPRIFDFKDEESGKKGVKNKAGFIAQEVEEVKPEWVNEKKGLKSLPNSLTGGVAPYLIKAIQELEARVKELENK